MNWKGLVCWIVLFVVFIILCITSLVGFGYIISIITGASVIKGCGVGLLFYWIMFLTTIYVIEKEI